jgi:molybdopterin-guanine dinucleotide biosynthesis adapter protein
MRVIGLAGWSGAGKTTLLRRLIPALIAQGLQVSTLKHAHHSFDIDQPGKDSWEHRQAGAKEVLVAWTDDPAAFSGRYRGTRQRRRVVRDSDRQH